MDIVKVFFETEKKLKILGHKEPALVFIKENGQKVSYSWGEYRRQALYAASAIRNLGWAKEGGKENFIGIISLNLPESFFALLGIILAGATPVPINHFLLKNARGREELKLILSNCKPKIVLANRGIVEESAKNKVNINGIREPEFFTIEEFLETGKRIFEKKLNGRFYCKEKKGGDLLIMPCTSGSSGNPKGVMLSHENIIDRAEAVTKELNVGPEDRILSYLPMGHISELIASFFGQITAGYTVYFTEYSRDREELKKHFPKVLKEVRPTVFLAVPKVWKNLRAGVEKKTKSLKIWLLRKILPDADSFIRRKVKEGLGFSQTKVFVSAASYLNPKDMEFFAGLDIKIRDIYGQTEVAGPLLIDGKPISVSEKQPAVVMLNQKVDNEILVIGKCVMLGYYQNETANQKAFSAQRTLYFTGDIGEMSPDQKIIYKGKKGRSFKLANGEYISDATVEFLEESAKSILRDIDPQTEVVICGDGQPQVVALVFISNKKNAKLYETIQSSLETVGEGLTKIKKVVILDSQTDLLLTPTLKPRYKEMIDKFKNLIID